MRECRFPSGSVALQGSAFGTGILPGAEGSGGALSQM